MDYPLAIAIALPTATFIVTCGSIIGKAISRNKPGCPTPSVSRKELNGILNKKFEKVVYTNTCDAVSEGIKSEMKLTRETLAKGIEDIKEEIRNSK